MKTPTLAALVTFAVASAPAPAKAPPPAALSGHYLEVRSCDVFTGACVANSEMGLSGKEGMLVWSALRGAWRGVSLDGLSVLAVVRTEATLGDVRHEPRAGRAVLIVDERASGDQRQALTEFVRDAAGPLVQDVLAIRPARMEISLGQCSSGSCARVKAGDLVEISTRCLGGKDHLCGNEENFYPPLTRVHAAFSAYTELAAYRGRDLDATWELAGRRSAYLGTFAR